MDRFKKFIEEDYYRIDHGNVPKTFSADYAHGHDNEKKEIKGTYATHVKHHMGHMYAAPRDIPRVYHQHQDGTKTLYMNKKHKNEVENHTATISRFNKKTSNFKKMDGGDEENLSKKDETPSSQEKIRAADHIRKQGIKIKYVSHNELKSRASESDNAEKHNLALAGNENMVRKKDY